MALVDRISRYQEWLNARGVQYNFDVEVPLLASRTKLTVTNDVPPVDLWHKILPTLAIVEMVREKYGPTTIHSAFRSTAYNLAIGGVGDSQHSKNDAIDFSCAKGTVEEWANYVKELRAEGKFMGGIGVYPTKGFVHIDTRGTKADWRG